MSSFLLSLSLSFIPHNPSKELWSHMIKQLAVFWIPSQWNWFDTSDLENGRTKIKSNMLKETITKVCSIKMLTAAAAAREDW